MSTIPHLDRLTTRQREVLQLAAEGLTNDEIAARLNLCEQSVKKCFMTIYTRLGVRQARQQAVLLYLRGC